MIKIFPKLDGVSKLLATALLRITNLTAGNLMKFTFFFPANKPPDVSILSCSSSACRSISLPPPPAATSQHSSRAVQLLRSSSACSRSVYIMQNVSGRAGCKTAKTASVRVPGKETNRGWRDSPSFMPLILESFHVSVCLKGAVG